MTGETDKAVMDSGAEGAGAQAEPVKLKTSLDRYLSPTDVWGMALGCMVGWGAFVMPGTTFLPIAGPAGTFIAIAIGVVIMLLIAVNVSFMMRKNPGTGGLYSYAKNAFGRDHAFLCAWFLCLSYLTIVFLNATALFIVIHTMFGTFFQGSPHYVIAGNDVHLSEVVTSVIAIALVGTLFIKAKAFLQRALTVLSIILFAGAVIITVVCLPNVMGTGALGSFGFKGVVPGYAIFTIVVLAPWAFVGFETVFFDTAHFKFPAKKTKWVVAIAILAAGFVYIAMVAVSVSAVPDGYASWQGYVADLDNLSGVEGVPTFFAAQASLGGPGLAIIAITALAAILTGIIAAYRATTRVLATMAEDRILSDKFTKTTYSILFIMILSIAISFLGRSVLTWFVELTSFGAVVAYGYASASAWKMARVENNRAIIITSAISVVIAVVFVLVHLIPRVFALGAMSGASFLLLSFWCLLGFLFYWRTVTHGNLSEYSGMSASGVVLFALLTYSALIWFAELLLKAESTADIPYLLSHQGLVLVAVIFVGLAIMLYVQNVVRTKHELLEREKIRAVEGSLAKSRFLFNMSHDIRTPMNAIIGYTNLAMKEETSPTTKEYLEKIEVSSQHLLELINDVLEMSRIESGKIELEYAPCDLCSVVDEVGDLFVQQMEQKQIEFSTHSTQVLHRFVWCDRKNLNRVLLNILSNAYKFTPKGGTVSISLWETVSGDERFGSYELRVRDSGIGMSKEFADKMFTAFERERTSTVSGIQGTGLGLAITKNIIDLMGGTIEVITSPGSGTEIIIRLKLQLASEEDVVKEAESAATVSPDEEAQLEGVRLLLVEDNDINREIAVIILTEEGFEVETAENGKQALDMIAASEPGDYDAVLMDIQMPVMDGYEATRAIRALDNQELASIPILAMTANAFKEDEEAAMEAGMQAHIAKPIDVPKMMATIRNVLVGDSAAGQGDNPEDGI